MTPEQMAQIAEYELVTPSLARKYARRHKKKLRLFMEQDGLCCLCDKPMMLGYAMGRGCYAMGRGCYATFEHVIPKSVGGPNHSYNVPLSHGRCNEVRGVTPFQDFKTVIAGNGGVLPKKPRNKNVQQHYDATRGDENALEHYLAKRLNLSLYIFEIEQGLKNNASVSLDELRRKEEKWLDFGNVTW